MVQFQILPLVYREVGSLRPLLTEFRGTSHARPDLFWKILSEMIKSKNLFLLREDSKIGILNEYIPQYAIVIPKYS